MASKNKKRQRLANNNGASSSSSISSLPKELLVEVVARVGSNSFIDLHNLKLRSKNFLRATENRLVMQQISLDRFRLKPWPISGKALKFLKHCKDCENLESLFMEGFFQFFKWPNPNFVALSTLKIAAEKGHKEAKYVYGMLLLASEDDELRKQGSEHMRVLWKLNCVHSCRDKVEKLSRNFWISNPMLIRSQTPVCNKSTYNGWRTKEGEWELSKDGDDDFDENLSEYCRWDHELECF